MRLLEWHGKRCFPASAPRSDPMESEPPPSAPPENTTFFQELKRRKVFQVAGTYLLVGWLVIQITVAVFPQFDIPT